MRKILFLSLLFAATMLSAQSPVELPLWPDGAPNTNGLTGEQEDLKGGRVANVTHPSIPFTVRQSPTVWPSLCALAVDTPVLP